MTHLITYVLASIGLTVLVVWPDSGPGAWARESVLRPLLPRAMKHALDCYICFSFWAAMTLTPVWQFIGRDDRLWLGCLMVPGLFWLTLRPLSSSSGMRAAREDQT